MDRNQILGIVLMALLTLGYFYFFPPESPPPATENTEQIEGGNQESEAQVASVPETDSATQDSLQNVALLAQFGVFAPAGAGQERSFTIDNGVLQLEFSSLGGSIREINLSQFQTSFDKPLILRDENSTKESYIVEAGNLRVDLRDLYFTSPAQDRLLAEGDTIEIPFTADLGGGRAVKQVYTIAKDSYVVGHRWEFEGLDSYLTGDMLLEVIHNMRHQEEDIRTSRQKATVIYYSAEGNREELQEASESFEEETLGEPLKWVNIKQKFFSTVYIADGAYSKGAFTTNVPNEYDTTSVKVATLAMTVPLTDASEDGLSFRYYFGPNDYDILDDVEEGLHRTVWMGWFPLNLISRWMIKPLFDLIHSGIASVGLVILLLVLLIKAILSPLTYRSYKSMARIRVLKPETDAIKEKYPEDMQKQQQETMALYRQVGVNPIAGCFPQLLQMPILFALFYFFPSVIEMRGESFLWAHDLSTFDSIISWNTPLPLIGWKHISLFTLLMTATTILTTWLNNQVTTVQGPMKTITYIMPIFFLFFLNNFPAALTFYYFVSNLITFGQQTIIRRYIDEDKIKSILEENKKNSGSKKKSKFQSRLEEAMKASEAAQKERQAQKQKQQNQQRNQPNKGKNKKKR
ncbi:MAG TPA: membrane protein insertase YidC [Cytophagales bacterium]|nr:membrane protein insertase YidC [Cytophagales bacterium]HAA18023.1 membrane protein insertase YidC [Cytophagales bacterium]HAP63069.1 membrane protein insertase YidC [Cytophagales bacterium]